MVDVPIGRAPALRFGDPTPIDASRLRCASGVAEHAAAPSIMRMQAHAVGKRPNLGRVEPRRDRTPDLSGPRDRGGRERLAAVARPHGSHAAVPIVMADRSSARVAADGTETRIARAARIARGRADPAAAPAPPRSEPCTRRAAPGAARHTVILRRR
ncbi:hypothetical protein [Burkholderia savannae]|uniref:hypothetical protein n=1 Tax=Burkholderia savannae TaxID=1637837 RepID=UPI0012E3A9BF|nr:hypothetical protein [Burkholderia savannae]